MSDNSPRRIVDARSLLDLAELTDVIFYEVRARRAPQATDSEVAIQIALRRDELVLEVRCRATVTGAGGEYFTDASAVFTLREQISATEDVITDFVERVGVMAVYPYLRESISQSAAKLGLERPILKLLRPGEVRVTVNRPDAAEAT
ncbi:hypothetical protein BXY47_0059 [Dietzia kunjamensis]|uniref:hypothetical protein n=1 Tax=Dietzia kunjamensis TaxID=322509 RepID=UPI000E70A249|nr:hypothetical protein [Dietzia kunjamensis]MBB1010706.1 hypothetical protein [Dietzia kunjamensis]RKE68954.1 hypothetical protein BXY47_0059 [Dietzia kunjamensis]